MSKDVYPIGGKGWYKIPGWRDGDRTLDQQITGLDMILPPMMVGKNVLELGCAEGIMSRWFVDHCGAATVHGIEIVPGHVELGRKWCKGRKGIQLAVADCDVWRPKSSYDVVVALALLHKLQDPIACLAAVAEAAREAVVLRLPSACSPWVITDARTGYRPFDVNHVLQQNGFRLAEHTMGPFNEPTGVWKRA